MDEINDKFPDELILKDGGMNNGKRIYILEHYFRFISSKGVIKAPKGFSSDLGSVPRLFQNIISKDGLALKIFIIHDFLYSDLNKNYTRLESDQILMEGMIILGVNWFTRQAIYRSVRLMGWKFYRGYED